MANIKSAKKRILVINRRTAENRLVKRALATEIKKFRKELDAKNVESAEKMLPSLVAHINEACSHGVIHKNNASRKVARLYLALNNAKLATAEKQPETVTPVVEEKVEVVTPVEEKPAKKVAKKATTKTAKTEEVKVEEKPAKKVAKKATAKTAKTTEVKAEEKPAKTTKTAAKSTAKKTTTKTAKAEEKTTAKKTAKKATK